MTNAVDNVVEQLAIAHSLHNWGAQVGCPGILPRRDLGLPTAVIGVADLAFLTINAASRRDIGRVRVCSQGVRAIPLAGRHGPVQKPLCDDTFQSRRVASRTRAFPHNECVKRTREDEQDAKRYEAATQSSIHGYWPLG